MAMQLVGKLRKPATDLTVQGFQLTPGTETIIVENELTAILWGAYGRTPTADDHDFAVPGSSLFTLPVQGGESRVFFSIDYAGAIPTTDTQAIVWATSCNFAPFVAPIA